MKVVYIGGYGRSGSTLVEDYIVSGFDFSVGVGEIFSVFDYCHTGKTCQCGDLLRQCEFWSKILVEFTDKDIKKIYETRRTQRIPQFSREYRQKVAQFKRAYLARLREVEDTIPMIVDSSKTARGAWLWPMQYKNHFGDDLLFIYLKKSPEDLLNSLSRGSNRFLKGESNQSYSQRFLFRSFFGWFYANLFSLYFVWRYPKNSVLLEYRTFCQNPEMFLNQISKKLQLNSVGSQNKLLQSHAIAGNRQRSKEKPVIRTDFSSYEAVNHIEFIVYGLFKFFDALFSFLARLKVRE